MSTHKPTRTAKPQTQKPKVSRRREQSANHGLPQAHVGRPVRGCACFQCETHRKLNRAAVRDHVLDLACKDAAMGRVTVSDTATDALREALGADESDYINARGL